MINELTRFERDLLVRRHREGRALYNKALSEHVDLLDRPGEIGIDESSSAYVDTAAYRQAKQAHAEMMAIEEEYFRRLPRLVMAPCPVCAAPLYRTIDPFGVDGLWWRSDAQPEEARPCAHFCVLLGAVALGAHRPSPDFDVRPGPGAPFVMPRLLAHEGMTAVVAELPLVEGAIAYPVAYFAARRPPVQSLAAPWARGSFVYTTQLGEHGWRRAEVPTGAPGDGTWDFVLAPWIESGRLRWCAPGSDRTRLAPAGAAGRPSPFEACSGPRAPQIIRASVPGAGDGSA